MIIRVGPGGQVNLEQIFTKQFIKKIASYSMDKSDNSIRIQFYDHSGKGLKAKLKTK